MVIERANLLNVSKLVIKELIDSSLSHGRMLDDDHVPLQQFFVVLEHVLRHGIKREYIRLSKSSDVSMCIVSVTEHSFLTTSNDLRNVLQII